MVYWMIVALAGMRDYHLTHLPRYCRTISMWFPRNFTRYWASLWV